MFAHVVTAAICGIDSFRCSVEADVSDGLPLFHMVGFLASEVREAQDRVRAALRNSGISIGAKHITVNLAPADLRKEGAAFDLPIAVAVLSAFGLFPPEHTERTLFLGELSLSGELRPVRGVLEIVSSAKSFGCDTVIVPDANLREGSVIQNVTVLGAGTLGEVIRYLETKDSGVLRSENVSIDDIRRRQLQEYPLDFSEIHGQKLLRRSAEVAVSGFHNLLMIGPPGSGKSMTARRIPTILPEPEVSEILEISKIHSIAGTLPPDEGLLTVRPFRAPHHTITAQALCGGGTSPHPGEISLAHRGVLFLDELPEFNSTVLETLRQPLEDGTIMVSRVNGSFLFPADFMLVAAMNPCPCGYFPDRKRCHCTPNAVRNYLGRISTPLLDRIDIAVNAPSVSLSDLTSSSEEETSAEIRTRVKAAREVQNLRYRGTPYRFNSDLSGSAVRRYCPLNTACQNIMSEAYDHYHLTARSYSRTLKVARTIADLAGSPDIRSQDLLEALTYRIPDREEWVSSF